MTTHPVLSRLDVADQGAVHCAAALLTGANHAHPARRLPGSAAATSAALGVRQFTDVLVIAAMFGHVELAHDRGHLVGVACWVEHPKPDRTVVPLPSVSASVGQSRAGLDCLSRILMLDLAFGVLPGSRHVHLACLGTHAGHGARMIADILVYHQGQLADRHDYPVYAEAHSEADLAWLRRLGGYDQCGESLSMPGESPSYALVRTTPGMRSPSQSTPAGCRS